MDIGGVMDSSIPFPSAAGTDPLAGLYWPGDRFYDRAGRTISVAQWAHLRGNGDYTVIGDWRDDNGSAVRTVWTGVDVHYGYADTFLFETHCLAGDDSYFNFYRTEADARRGHADAVARIVCNPRPWDQSSAGSAAESRRRAAMPRLEGLSEAAFREVHPTRFFDREGNSITLPQWVRLRRDSEYCVIDRWRGEGGAHVEVYWTGVDLLCGFMSRPPVFELCVAAFDACPLADSTYKFFVEARALDHFQKIIPLVERGIRPWDDEAVAAAAFDPLELRSW